MESPNQPGKLQRIEEGQRLGNYYTWKYAGIDADDAVLQRFAHAEDAA